MKKVCKANSLLAFLFVALFIQIPLARADISIPYVNTITSWLLSPPGYVAMGISFVWDIVRRLWPTVQPAGLIHDIGMVVTQIGNLLIALGQFSDNILPQNISPPDKKA